MILKHTDFEVPGFGELADPPAATPGYADALLSLSPTAYWPLGEDTGTTAADLAGSHPLALTGDATLDRPAAHPSADDGALRVETGGATSAGAVLPTTAAAAFSIIFWVRRLVPGEAGRFLGQYDGSAAGRMSIHIIADGRLRLFVVGDPSTTSTAAAIDQWTHAVITRDTAGNSRWYLNGVADTTGTGQATAIPDTPFALGKQTSNTIDTEIDEVAVFPTALSADEAAWLYRVATDQPVPTPAPGT